MLTKPFNSECPESRVDRYPSVAPRRPFYVFHMSAKQKTAKPLTGADLIKETCRRIRLARGLWDQHRNAACRGERVKAMALYESLSEGEREKVPQVLRVWLRYRSEKYFGEGRTTRRSSPDKRRKGGTRRSAQAAWGFGATESRYCGTSLM